MLTASTFLLTVSLLLQYSRFYQEDYFGKQVLTFAFNVNKEGNIPTLFSAGQLFLCSLLALRVWRVPDAGHDARESGRWWRILGFVFLAMSVEEVISSRSLITYGLGALLGSTSQTLGGALRFLWVAPGVVFVILFVAVFVKFLSSLHLRTRSVFILAGAMYVSGSLGMEMLSGVWINAYGQATPGYSLLTTIEEALEMFAVAMLAAAILDYLHTVGGEGILSRKPTPQAASVETPR